MNTITIKPLAAATAAAAVLVVGGLGGAAIGHATADQAAAAATPSPAPSDAAVNAVGPLAGGWHMTSLEVGSAGDLQEIPYSGQITFDPSGRVAVQALNPDTSAPDTEFTVSGYEAWAGQASVDQSAGTFTARVDTAVARTMIGTDQDRRFEVRDDTLVLTPADGSGAFRATYERW